MMSCSAAVIALVPGQPHSADQASDHQSLKENPTALARPTGRFSTGFTSSAFMILPHFIAKSSAERALPVRDCTGNPQTIHRQSTGALSNRPHALKDSHHNR